MSDWTAGYVADIGYTFGYYTELNPLRIKLAFLNQGLAFPEVGTACELGFGQGVSANMHAAASITQWHGTDFNPSQAAFAQELATASGSGAQLCDDSFAEFACRTDLPDFDYISLHGIWSWISDENRKIIVDFIRRKLKVGGVLYISYNTMPGWSTFAPMRHLMTSHAEVMGSAGNGIVNRIDGAIEFATKLLGTNPNYARANPLVTERLEKMKAHNRQYLAHEYFNRDWHPMYFTKMAEWLSDAKVQYACSAHYLDHVDVLNLRPEQLTLLNEIPDLHFRESVRDFMVNQQFRRDYWVKGLRKQNAYELSAAIQAQRVILVTHSNDVSLKVTGALGEASMTESIYAPIIEVLADNMPKSLGDIFNALQVRGVSMTQLMQAIMVLAGTGYIYAARDDAAIANSRDSTQKMNRLLCSKAHASGDISYLVSPVTGGGIPVNRIQQLFLHTINQGRKLPSEWASFVWAILSSQGQKLVKDGATLASPEENLSELIEQSQIFSDKQLPILKALQIV